MDADFSEFNQLARDLNDAGENIARFVDKAIKFTAVNVKKDWRQGADRSGLGLYAADIDFDMQYPRGEIIAEIGPTPGDSGGLGIVEDAPGDVKSAPQHAGRDALEANEEDFIRGLEIAIADSLGVVFE